MALTDYDAYLDALKANRVADFQTLGTVGRPNRLSAAWRFFVPAALTPTTSVATSRSSDIAIGPIPDVGAGRLSILGARMGTSGNSGVGCILVDVLNHSGGLSGTSTAAQTTGLPTAALTRYTSGEGVMAAVIIYTQLGTTATTFVVSYTNQSGTSGRTSTATQIGAGNFNNVASVIMIPLQADDTGVRSVQSVTLAGTTGGVGNFGVVLFKPLAMMALNDVMSAMPIDSVSSGGFIGALAEVQPNACLSVIVNQVTVQSTNGAVILAEV